MDLALFDFDGTVTERDPSKGKDSFSGFVRFAVRPSRKAVGAVLLGPVLLGYRLRWISASRARRAVVMVAFRGESAGRVRQLGLQFATEALPPSMRQRALERIRWHQDRGDEVVVVSAALDVYLRPLCQTIGVHCICTELDERGGVLTGRYRGRDCCGFEKARRAAERFPPERYSLIWGYGDTAEDREMLDLAHRRFYRWREVRCANGMT